MGPIRPARVVVGFSEMSLLTRFTRSVRFRWGRPTRECDKARDELRRVVAMADQDVLACLSLERTSSASDAAWLLTHFRTRRTASPLFRSSERKEFAGLFAERFQNSSQETIRRADLARRHVINLLGSGDVFLGDPINWWTDFKGGTWAKGDYEELNATLYVDDFRNDRYIGDIKLPWELNKHGHFLDLAKAYWLTGDERYAEALLVQM